MPKRPKRTVASRVDLWINIWTRIFNLQWEKQLAKTPDISQFVFCEVGTLLILCLKSWAPICPGPLNFISLTHAVFAIGGVINTINFHDVYIISSILGDLIYYISTIVPRLYLNRSGSHLDRRKIKVFLHANVFHGGSVRAIQEWLNLDIHVSLEFLQVASAFKNRLR